MVHRFVRTSVSVALSAAFIFAAPAVAAPVADGESTVVRTADLDLSSDVGVHALQTRVAYAARSVCGDVDPLDLPAVQQSNECRKVALDSAAPQEQLAIANARQGKAYVVASAGVIHLARR